MQIEKSMMLITSNYKGVPNFIAIPLVLSCPYNQMIYNPQIRELGIVSKEVVNMPNLIPKLNDEGFSVPAKQDKTKIAQERRSMDVNHEYIVKLEVEMKTLIDMFCINAEEFDWKQYLAPAAPKGQFSDKIEE